MQFSGLQFPIFFCTLKRILYETGNKAALNILWWAIPLFQPWIPWELIICDYSIDPFAS